MDVFNRGDKVYLLIGYKVNGQDMQKDAYEEIELQINKQSDFRSVKKLLSTGDIFWGENLTYLDDKEQEQLFTGYVCALSQEDTFKISDGISNVQLRVMVDKEVGSSSFQDIDLGSVLSDKIL